MKNYSHFPKFQNFIEVLEKHPQSAFIFVHLNHMLRKNDDKKFLLTKDDIGEIFGISMTIFRNLCVPLNRSGFVIIEEDKKQRGLFMIYKGSN